MSARETPPVGFAPVVKDGGIGQGIGIRVIHAALRLFDIVMRRVERAPTGIARLFFERGAPFAAVTPFGDTEFREVLLALLERDVISAARHARKPQLREIVFPQADRAFLVIAGLTQKHLMAAARAGIFGAMHHDLTIGRSTA